MSNMASFEDEGLKVVEKFEGGNFYLWKFKIVMVLDNKDLWEIVEGNEPPFFLHPILR